nr:MAG TPA: hypothetical protein [Caudoviricetes sp.]
MEFSSFERFPLVPVSRLRSLLSTVIYYHKRRNNAIVFYEQTVNKL